MENNLMAIAKDNTIRISPLKLKNVANLIVDLKVNKAIRVNVAGINNVERIPVC